MIDGRCFCWNTPDYFTNSYITYLSIRYSISPSDTPPRDGDPGFPPPHGAGGGSGALAIMLPRYASNPLGVSNVGNKTGTESRSDHRQRPVHLIRLLLRLGFAYCASSSIFHFPETLQYGPRLSSVIVHLYPHPL